MSGVDQRRGGRRSLGAVFAMPAAIAATSLFGLIIALTGDGLRDLLAWATLAIPIAAFAWAHARRRR